MAENVETILADYVCPEAVMVPHYRCELTGLLEEIATRVSRSCGVILLSNDKIFSQAFIETQNRPEHFSIITAPFDTPWIRDRSPIAVKTVDGIRWYHPGSPQMGRPNDDRLFELISAKKHHHSPIKILPQGNIVAGPNGLVLVSRVLLKQNSLTEKSLHNYNAGMGASNWIVFSSFYAEETGHADIHVRVLNAKTFAIAWNLSSKRDRQSALQLIKKIKSYDAKARIVKIPIRSRGGKYASLVNWIQLGKRLIIPRYDLTKPADVICTKQRLKALGFKVEFIYSPTLELSGSLHCLTAAIFV